MSNKPISTSTIRLPGLFREVSRFNVLSFQVGDETEELLNQPIFSQSSNRLTSRRKFEHIPEIAARFGLTMPDRTIFPRPDDQWKELVKQYNYKHLSKLVPVESDLMRPEAYFIQSVRNGDIAAFNKFDLTKIDFITMETALTNIFSKPLDRSRFDMTMKMLSRLKFSQKQAMLDFASKIGDLDSFDIIDQNFDNIEIYKVEYFIRDGHTQRAIDVTKQIIPQIQRDAENIDISFLDIHGEDPFYDTEEPEYRAGEKLSQIEELNSTNPVIHELIRETEEFFEFKSEQFVNLESVKSFLATINLSSLNPIERELVDEYLPYLRSMLRNMENAMTEIRQKYIFEMLEIMRFYAVQNDNVEYFKFLLKHLRSYDNKIAIASFLNNTVYHASGQNYDDVPIKTKIFNMIIDDVEPDIRSVSRAIMAMRNGNFAEFKNATDGLRSECCDNIPNEDGLIQMALMNNDTRFIEYLNYSLIEDMIMKIENYDWIGIRLSPDVIELFKNDSHYRYIPLRSFEAVSAVDEADKVRVVKFFDNIGKISKDDMFLIMDDYICKQTADKQNPSTLFAILSTRAAQKYFDSKDIDQILYQISAPGYLEIFNSDIVRLLLNHAMRPVEIQYYFLKALVVAKGDRDLYIEILRMIKDGRIYINDRENEIAQISLELAESGFKEMSQLADLVFKSGNRARL